MPADGLHGQPTEVRRTDSILVVLKRLWGELDTEKTGFISLKEIDFKAMACVFKHVFIVSPARHIRS